MQRKTSHRKLTVGVLFAAIAQVLWPAAAAAQSLPLNPSAMNGATAGVSGNTMTVTVTAPRAFINWNSFDVGTGYTFNANGPANFVLLNRVTGATFSTLDGNINSNGNIWLLNPNGVLVGGNARINVGGMLLSTAGLTDADFLDGNATYTFSGASNNNVSVAPGALMTATTGGLYLQANQVSMSGGMQSAGTNAVIGSRSMVVSFDANLSAITSLDLGAGSNATNSVFINNGASFYGGRNVITAAGMSTGQGNVLLQNYGGANDIRINAGAVELVSRDADVTIQNMLVTPADLSITAANMIWATGQVTVGGNYTVTAKDFSGALSPIFVGTNNNFTVTDTAFGISLNGLSAPGNLTVNSYDGLNILSGGSGFTSTNGNISLNSAGDINLQGNVTTGTAAGRTVTINSSGGRISQMGGSVVTTDHLTAVAGNDIFMGALNRFNIGTFENSGPTGISARSITPNVFYDYAHSSGGNVFLAADNGMRLSGANYRADSGAFQIGSRAVITGGSATIAGTTVSFGDTLDSSGTPATLTVNAPGGANFNRGAGGTSMLRQLIVNGPSIFAAYPVRTTNGIQLGGTVQTVGGGTLFDAGSGVLSITGDVLAQGNLDLRGAYIDVRNVETSNPAATIAFTSTFDTALTGANASGVQFNAGGNVTATGIIDTATLSGTVTGNTTLLGDNQVDAIGAFNAGTGFQLRNFGPLSITGNLASTGDVRLEVFGGNIDIDGTGHIAGRAVVLSSQNFFNNAGASAIDASGHWVIYQGSRPSSPNYGGLDSGQTALWGQTYGSTPPSSISGNRYVFTFQPLLQFTTTDTSKIYGTDLTGAPGMFTVTGYMPGVTGAYLGDTAATAFSGAPLVTSTGFGERASVAGGPYAMNIANGSLVNLAGYAFAFNGTGNLTVTPKMLTGTATTNGKVYDGTTNATGSISLAGVVTGDTVGANGTFTFTTKDAGLGKSVTLTGATLTGADAGNYTLSIPLSTVGDILQKAITGTGTVDTKTYDGNANGTGTITLTGVIAGDDLDAIGTFTFFDKNAGTNKTVTLSGVSLTGADAGNYTLSVPASLLGDILQKSITGTPVATTKTYDGTNAGSGSIGLNGVVAGDDLAASGTFTFDTKNAGAGKTVTVSGVSLSGADAGNYTVTVPASVLGDILQKALTGTTSVDTKTYDGTRNATGTITLAGVVAGDDVDAGASFVFGDKNAGTGKSVTVSGVALTGADAGNYTITVPASALGDILQKAITGTGTVDTKTYDGTANGTGSIALNGVIAGDDLDASGTFTFFDKNAGTNKTVTLSGVSLTGADAGNYTLSVPASLFGDILQKAITGTPVANTKTYDGTNAGTGTIGLTGVIAGDDLAANGTFTFDTKNAGTGKIVTVSGVSLSGADAGNYTLTLPASVLGDILQKALTGTTAITTKTYDGTRNATGTIMLNGVVAGDDVDAGASFVFDDKNAGSGKSVTVSGVALTGADAGNYTITLPASALGDILQKAITGTTSIDAKTYDGTRNATGTIALNGVVGGDAVNAGGTFTFADKNAGAGKQVTVSGVTLGGADAGNYTITVSTSAIGDILRKSITGVASVNNKTYDGTRNATGSITLNGVIAGDSVGANGTYTFADANAGNGKSVAVNGVSLTGADAGNYTIVVNGATVADILQRSITVTANPLTKVEGTIDPALTWGVTQGSLVAGETLAGALTRAPGEAPGAYAIGQGTLSASANYRLTFVGSTLTITEAPATPVVDPLAGLALNDDIAGVLQFLERDEKATTLEITDERACNQSKDSTCDKQ